MEGTQGTQATPTGTETKSNGSDVRADNVVPTGTDGTGTSSIKEAAAEAKRRLKIDDQEIDEDEVIKVYKDRKGHQRVANKELQEGRAAKKQAEEFISMMKDKQKLFDVLKKMGHDPRQLSEEYLASILEEEMMDPREKELKQYKTKLQQYQELEKQQKEFEAKKRDDALKAKFSDDYSKQFIEALKTSKLPPTKPMVAKMAEYIQRAAEMKFEMTASEAAQLVKEDIETAHRNLYGEADAETLVKLIGEQGLQKVRGYDTARLKDPAANLKTPEKQGEVNRSRYTQPQRMSRKEWRDYNRK
jgi:hypothetical protein